MDEFDLKKLRANDNAEWQQLIQRVSDIAVEIANARGLNSEDAKDIAQETLIGLSRLSRKYRLSNSLIRTIAQRRGDDQLRYRFAARRDRRKEESLEARIENSGGAFDPAAPDLDAPSPRQDEKERLDQALDELGEPCRSQLLDFAQDMSHKELGEIYECSPGNMRLRIHRCRKRLLEIMKRRKWW